VDPRRTVYGSRIFNFRRQAEPAPTELASLHDFPDGTDCRELAAASTGAGLLGALYWRRAR
jgi:hypothetical protein